MQWIAGYIPSESTDRLGWRPRNGVALDWPTPVWTAGFDEQLRRTVTEDSGRTVLTVIGHCLADDAELRQSLGAVRRGDWSELRQWPGRYWVVAKRLEEVVVIGDMPGVSKVFYASAPGGWLWGSAVTPLAAWTGAEPDITALLLDITTAGLEPFGGSSLFAPVSRVPSGSLVSFQGKATVCPWYVPSLLDTSFELGAERFAYEWLESMHRHGRYTGLPSGEFSGGTDSSAIIATILAMMMNSGSDGIRKVLGITIAEPDGSDVRWAREIAKELAGLDHEIIERSAQMLHFEGFDDPGGWIPHLDQPSPDICGLAQHVPGLLRASAYGSQDFYIGLGGDEVLTAHPTTLATAWKRAGKQAAWHQARSLAHNQGASPVKVAAAAYRQLIRTSYPQAIAAMSETITAMRVGPGQRQTGLAWCQPLASAWWLTRSGARQVSERLSELAGNLTGITDPELYHTWLGVRRAAMDTDGFRQVAAAHGMEIHQPYFDPGVLAAALELPGYIRQPPEQYKSLIRENPWLTPSLPPALVKRSRKGGGSDVMAVEGQRLREATLLQLLATSPLVTSGFVDAGRVEQALRDITDDFRPTYAAPYRLFAIDRWLRQLNTRRTTYWEEV